MTFCRIGLVWSSLQAETLVSRQLRAGERGRDDVDSDAGRDKLKAKMKAKPMVLRVADEDMAHLATHPAYVRYGLFNLARHTVLAPTAVFRGLKRGDNAPPNVENGWAFCGKPRHAFCNDGTTYPAPDGMVYAVFADNDGFVFDWDWVQEDPDKPGYPLGPVTARFAQEVMFDEEVVLALPPDLAPGQFDRTQACYSSRLTNSICLTHCKNTTGQIDGGVANCIKRCTVNSD